MENKVNFGALPGRGGGVKKETPFNMDSSTHGKVNGNILFIFLSRVMPSLLYL